MNFDGEDGSRDFTDSSNRNIPVAEATAVLSAEQAKFGGTSGYFDGRSTYVKIPATDGLYFDESDDFTIEFWCYIKSLENNLSYILVTNNVLEPENSFVGIGFGNNNTNYNKLMFFQTTSKGNAILKTNKELPLQTWFHFAVSRQSGRLRMFIDGKTVYDAVNTIAYPFNGGGYGLILGGAYWNNGNNYANVYLDDLRITKDIARYTADFTPPTEAFRL